MNEFEKVIKTYLDEFAANDGEFAKKYDEKAERLGGVDKVITQCCNFICHEVMKTGRQGFADNEVYGMAVHFIDEPELTAEEGVNGHVVVNHSIELTEADKERLRKEAEAEYKGNVKRCIAKEALSEKEKSIKTPAAKKEKPIKQQPQQEEGGLLFSFDE